MSTEGFETVDTLIKKINDGTLGTLADLSRLSSMLGSFPDSGVSKRDANTIIPVIREFIDVISIKETWGKDEIVTVLKEILVSSGRTKPTKK